MRKTLYAALLGLALAAGLWSDASIAQPAQCGRTAVGSSAAATTLVITGQAGGIVHLCGWDVTSTAAATFQIITGTGATCGTNTVNITAAHALGVTNVYSSSGATAGRYSAPAGNSICVIVTGTGPAQWTIFYALFF
jgi:hypothetical protein